MFGRSRRQTATTVGQAIAIDEMTEAPYAAAVAPPSTLHNGDGVCQSGLNGLTAGGTEGLDTVCCLDVYWTSDVALAFFEAGAAQTQCCVFSVLKYCCLVQGCFHVAAQQPVLYTVQESENLLSLDNMVSYTSCNMCLPDGVCTLQR